jgi:hypothetical protein
MTDQVEREVQDYIKRGEIRWKGTEKTVFNLFLTERKDDAQKQQYKSRCQKENTKGLDETKKNFIFGVYTQICLKNLIVVHVDSN